MNSTKIVPDEADLTLTYRANGMTHTVTGKVKAQIDYDVEYATEYSDWDYRGVTFPTREEYTLKFIPNEGKYTTVTSSKDFEESRVITITVPALTPKNIDRARIQAGMEDEEFMIDINDDGQYKLTWAVDNE